VSRRARSPAARVPVVGASGKDLLMWREVNEGDQHWQSGRQYDADVFADEVFAQCGGRVVVLQLVLISLFGDLQRLPLCPT